MYHALKITTEKKQMFLVTEFLVAEWKKRQYATYSHPPIQYATYYFYSNRIYLLAENTDFYLLKIC